MQTDLIIVNEYCRICHIEPSFIFRLEEGGLIEIRIIEGEKYLQAEQSVSYTHLTLPTNSRV